ncbi:MAG: lysophospholipid acyltransferase family protein [Alistipes sp.]|nr:lysophospholipid acyltransferase family protein [Alistipes sp.]
MENSKPNLSFGAKCLWLLCRSVAILPHWVQYKCIAGFLYFLLRYVVRYRRKLIIKQIADSFPLKSEQEVAQICNEFYNHLAEVFISTMNMAGITDEEREKLIKFNVPDSVKEVVDGRHLVVLASHYGFWEYAQFVGLAITGYSMVGAYHPLSSKAWDELFQHLRTFKDVYPIPSQRYVRYFIENHKTGVAGKPMMLGLASDQNSPPKGKVHWYNFLNRPTLFFDGGEQLATKFSLPVVYLSMRKVAQGKYDCDVILVHDGREPLEKHEITERYVRLLERDIEREPAYWMWSHRRWKYYPDPVTGEPIYRRKGV